MGKDSLFSTTLLLHICLLFSVRKVKKWFNWGFKGNHLSLFMKLIVTRVLSAAALSTSGDVLEMGTGFFSTPVLHDIVSSKVWKLLIWSFYLGMLQTQYAHELLAYSWTAVLIITLCPYHQQLPYPCPIPAPNVNKSPEPTFTGRKVTGLHWIRFDLVVKVP